MQNIDRLQASVAIRQTRGKIFTALFVKTNGEVRKMNCRTGVKKDVVGSKRGRTVTDKREMKGLIAIYDVQKGKGWRTINLYTLLQLRIGKKVFYVS